MNIEQLKKRIMARGDNSYTEGLAICRQDECLGYEIKMEQGNFGEAELKTHKLAAERFGMHKAFYEVLQMMHETNGE